MRKLLDPIHFTRDEVLALVQARECDHCLGVSQPEPGDTVRIDRTSAAFVVEWICPHCCPPWYWPFGRNELTNVVYVSDLMRVRKGLLPDARFRDMEGFPLRGAG